MGNGRSLVLGSSPTESEGSELMEGASAAVGRQQILCSQESFSSPRLLTPLLVLFFLGSAEFQLIPENQEDSTPPNIQATPSKKPGELPDSADSPPSKPPTLHKHPPALPPKPFNRLPNHLTGTSSL